MAKLFGLVVTGFIFVLLLNGSKANVKKLINNLQKLFQIHYSNFEILRLIGNDLNQHSWKGFSAKFYEYSSESYDLSLKTLDLSSKHGIVFSFQEVALSNYLQNVLETEKSDKNRKSDKQLKKNLIKNICKNRNTNAMTTMDECMKPPNICMKLTNSKAKACKQYIKELEKSILKFYKCKEPIKPVRALEFLQLSNAKMLHKIIGQVINQDNKHVTHIMKKVFLNHLYHQMKELSDMTTILASNDRFKEFLMDKSLRCSQPKYQEFYTS